MNGGDVNVDDQTGGQGCNNGATTQVLLGASGCWVNVRSDGIISGCQYVIKSWSFRYFVINMVYTRAADRSVTVTTSIATG